MADDKRKHALWWWIDRFRKSTAYTDMTLSEQGAYRNLLDEQRLRGGLIPNDERILAKVCGDALEWPRVRGAVLARFEATADGKHLFNRTATEVNAVSDSLSATRAEVGRLGFEKVERGPSGHFTGKATGKPSGNGTGNPTGKATASPSGNGTGSVSVAVSGVRGPLSGSVADTDEPALSRASGDRPPPRANPMVGARRVPLEREWLELVDLVSKATGDPPEQVAPPFKGRSILNPADLTDDRLLRDLIDLRKRRDAIPPAKEPDPAEAEVLEAAWRSKPVLVKEFLAWYTENPEAGDESGRHGLHGIAFGRWPKAGDLPGEVRVAVLNEALAAIKQRRAG